MTNAEARLRELFDAAGTTGWLHARDLASGDEIGLGPDDPVVLASVFKIPVLLELFAQAEEGRLDVRAPVTVPVEQRAPGPFGLSVMRDAAQLSLRDLAWLMMGISDNAATDVICAAVGIESVNARLAGLGLADTVLIGDCRAIFATVSEDVGAELDAIDLTDVTLLDRMRALDPTATSRSTPRQVSELLAKIWSDEAASPEACAEVRRILSLQVWPHRLSSGFPEDDIRVSAKTGTLPRLRNECGVVEYGDGSRFAVAVFTRSTSTATKNPAADSVIGTAARCAVDLLRGAPVA
jgi:beta-lactamase class A